MKIVTPAYEQYDKIVTPAWEKYVKRLKEINEM